MFITPTLPILLFAFSTILAWGCWGFFGKLALARGASPLMIFLAEIAISFFCAAILLLRGLTIPGHPWFKGLNIFGLLSGLALAVGLVCYYFALNRADASVIVPLTALYPAVSVALGYACLGERLTRLQWAGLILAMAGAGLLVMTPTGSK